MTDLYPQARALVLESGKASASLLQRRLRIDYATAKKLMDELEHQGVISAPDGNRPRDVLVKA